MNQPEKNVPNMPEGYEPPAPSESTEKLLKNMPAVIGAIDKTIFDIVGKRLPVMLIVFDDKAAIHGTNIDVATAQKATAAVVRDWGVE